jgi:CrcB protein
MAGQNAGVPLLDRPTGWSTASALYAGVLLGGMLGGTARHLVAQLVPAAPGTMPWGIVAVNLLGALLLGALLGGWTRQGRVAHPWRPFLATGVLGSFTTWSTFMADTLALMRADAVVLGLVHLVGVTAAGIAMAALGWRAGESMAGRVR